jgi:hypothetical protein
MILLVIRMSCLFMSWLPVAVFSSLRIKNQCEVIWSNFAYLGEAEAPMIS